jgi:GMP synthase-like glutamine amidotransferase
MKLLLKMKLSDFKKLWDGDSYTSANEDFLAKYFGININSKDIPCVGTNFLDLKSLNLSQIQNDIYLSKINFELVSKSFSFHNDYVDLNQLENSNDLIKIALSKHKYPYILKHKSLKMYGFQFHPEVNVDAINDVIDKFNLNKCSINLEIEFIEHIQKHFFQIFLS